MCHHKELSAEADVEQLKASEQEALRDMLSGGQAKSDVKKSNMKLKDNVAFTAFYFSYIGELSQTMLTARMLFESWI
jgi:heme oxygenase